MPGMNDRRRNQLTQSIVTQSLTNGLFLTTSASVLQFTAIAFSVAQMPSFGTYTALFDQYRILEVECWVQPAVVENVAGTGEIGQYVTCVDYDDATAPTTLAQIQIKPGALQCSLFQAQYFRFTPKAAIGAYTGSVFTGFSVANDDLWYNASSSAVQFYGLKIGTTLSTNAVPIELIVRYTVEFRGAN